jgi:hypothetical protein
MYAGGCIMYAEDLKMPLLQVRDCPEDIYKRISSVAKKQNRTIAQQTIVLLEKGLGQEEPNIERRRQLLEKINAREISQNIKDIDAVALIREDRDR